MTSLSPRKKQLPSIKGGQWKKQEQAREEAAQSAAVARSCPSAARCHYTSTPPRAAPPRKVSPGAGPQQALQEPRAGTHRQRSLPRMAAKFTAFQEPEPSRQTRISSLLNALEVIRFSWNSRDLVFSICKSVFYLLS